MAHQHDQDPRQRPTEGRRDLRNLNLDPQDFWDEPVNRSDSVETAGYDLAYASERPRGAKKADADKHKRPRRPQQ
jgi:hypothetical protein